MNVSSMHHEAVTAEPVPSSATAAAKASRVTATPAGTVVMLLDQHEGGAVSARVQTWSATDGGMVMSTRLTLGASDVQRLAGRRVWVSVTDDGPGYSVFGGIARAAGENTLDVTGIAPLVQEARRTTPRAQHRDTVTLTIPGMRPRDLRAVDLSRGGVRVSMEGRSLTSGEHVLVEMALEGGLPVQAEGEVSRVDTGTGEAVVRFQNLDASTGSRLDRFLLRRVARPS